MDPSEVAEGAGEEGGLPPSGFELRLGDGRAFIGASGRPLAEGVVVRRFSMEIPEVRFPFDVTGGADRFRHQRCVLHDLDLSVDSSALERWLPAALDLATLGIDQLSIACRTSFLELSGRHATSGAFTLKAALEPDGPGIGVVLYELRFYRSSPLCAAVLLHRLAAAARASLQPSGPTRVRCDPLPPALRSLLITRGFKLPDTRGLQLSGLEFHPGQLVVSFKPEGPATPMEADHLTALEGARALRDVEELIAKGDLTGARSHLLSLSRVDAQHPFAAERLLQILAADTSSHDLALDLCEIGRQRGALIPAALWVEGCIRQSQGDLARSARVFCELAEWALRHRELSSAAAAARAASELALEANDDELASRALSLRQAAQPEDLEVLTSLAEVAERQGDTPAELSALRRIAAFGGDGPRTARAHARLGMIFLKQAEDLPRARLHLDQALRLDPSDRESILALAGACERSGEHLRAVRMLDRAFELAMGRGESTEAARLANEIGRLWENRLDHAENALLRYREAASLMEKATGHAATDVALTQRIAQLHERLGHWTEALEAQWLLASRRDPGRGRAEALLEIARILRSRLNDPTEAENTCLRALDEDPTFFEAAALLCDLRRGGAPGPFCAALSAAAEATTGAPRAALLAERGEIESRVLLDPNSARRSFSAAVETDPGSLRGWLGLASSAESANDLPTLIGALERLAELADPGGDRLSVLRRLADAYEQSGDEVGAQETLVRALGEPEADPDLMARLVALYRRRGEFAEAAELCASLARLARSRGDDARLLVALLEETELLLQIPGGEFRAAERIGEALALAPRSILVLQLAATCAERTGDAATAREKLLQLLEVVGNEDRVGQAAVYRRLAEAHLALESLSDAAEALEEAARRNVAPETLERLEEVYRRMKRPAETIATQERLARLHEERGRWVTAASLWLALSEAYAAQGEPEAGLSALHRAASCGLQTSGTDGTALAAEAFRRRAELLQALGDRAGSAEALERQADLMTDGRAKARALRAAAESQPDPERAERATRAAVDADDTYPWGQAVLGLLELRDGRPEAARQAFEEALLSPADPPDALSLQETLICHAGAGAAARILGFHGVELAHLESLLIAAPEERAYLARRCELLRELQDVPELIGALTSLAGVLSGAEAADPYAEIGRLREQAGETELAGEAFLAALSHDPNHFEAVAGALRCVPREPTDRRASLLRRFLTLQPTGGTELGPEEQRYPYELAELMEAGDPAEALAAWEQASESDPANPIPWMHRGALLERAGRAREAAQAWLSAADRKRERNELAADERLHAARMLLSLGDADAATAVIEAALRETAPEPAPLWLLLAEAHQRAGRAEAEAEALAHAAPLLPPRQRAPLWGRRAELLRGLGDRAGEREALSQAIAYARRDEALLQALRDACLALGDVEGACDALELTLDAAAGDREKIVAAAMELGQLALESLHHPQRAEAAFRRALGGAPDQRTALRQLASILLARGEVQEGLDLLRRDCEAEPDLALASAQRLELAELAWSAHADSEVALAQVRRVLQIEPDSLPAIRLACELLYGAGASTEALPLLRRLAAESWEDQPEELERYLLWLADAEATDGNVAEARRALERLMVERPACTVAAERWADLSREWEAPEATQHLQDQAARLDSPRARAVLLAEAAHRTPESDAATRADLLRRALESDPRPDLSDEIQHLLEATGDGAGLADELARAATRADGPERMALLLRRARLLEEIGASEAARSAWEAVAEAGPQGDGYVEALNHRLERALAEQQPQRAVESLLALAERAEDPVHRAALLQRAAAISSEAVGDSPQAIELLRAAAEASGSARAHALLAEAYRREGRWDEAVAAMERELPLLPPDERQSRERRLGLLLWQDLHQPARALPHLLAGLEGAAAEPAELEALASCAAEVGAPAQELAALERIKARTTSGRFPPDREERRIQLLEELGRDEDAISAWRSLLQQDPLSAAPFSGLRRALEARHAWRELSVLIQERADALEIAGEEGLDERAALLCDRAALLAGELRDLDEAARGYREVLTVLPGYRLALAALRALREAAGDLEEAAALLEAEIDAGAPPAQLAALELHLGKLRLQLDEPEKALEWFERAAQIAADAERPALQAEAWVQAGGVLLALGRAPEAWTHGDEALAIATPEIAAEAQAICAEAAFQTGSAIEAREHWRALLQARPGDPRALRGLDAVARLGEPTLEEELLKKRTRGDGDPIERAKAWRGLAELRLGPLEDPIGGEHALLEALRLDPGDPTPFERLCRLLESQNRFHELAASLHDRAQLVASVPEQSALFREEGELLRTRLADPRRAAEVYARALELDPADAGALEGLAESLLTLGKLDRARDCYRRALELGGGQLGKFFLLYRLGDLERRSGHAAEALELFQESSENNPSFLPAREGAADLAAELGHTEQALEALTGMLGALDPAQFPDQHAAALLRIADIERRAQRFDEAQNAVARAAELIPNDPAPVERMAALAQESANWPEALAALTRLAGLQQLDARAATLRLAAEVALERLADADRAIELLDLALAESPSDARTMERLAEIAAERGLHDRLVAMADRAGIEAPPYWLEPLLPAVGRSLLSLGRFEDAHRALSLARHRAPEDRALLEDLAGLADRLGRFGEAVDLQEAHAESLASSLPLEAASRLRMLARRALEQLEDPARAERLLDRAGRLAQARPEDRRLLADLKRNHTGQELNALTLYLDLVRENPLGDLALLRACGTTAADLGAQELSQVALGLASALEGVPAPSPAPPLLTLPRQAWSQAFLTVGPLEQLLQELAPYLEPLFPANLTRYAVGDPDRVGPNHAPQLHEWVERVRAALRARPATVYLSVGFPSMAIESTRPPSLIVGGVALAALGSGPMQFLLAQRLALVELGFALPSKFSPKDITTLARLAVRFITGEPVADPAEEQRLGPFLDALERGCPAQIRVQLEEVASRATRELAAFDPRRHAIAAVARANRMALWITGDLSGALSALEFMERGGSDAGTKPWQYPQGRALIDWAFSQEFLDLRKSLGPGSE